MSERGRVLFVCVHNSARSQMAEEYLRKYGWDLFEVESAGLEPGTINPVVVELLKEEGIDISAKKTRSVFDLYKEGRAYEYVITVCDRKAEENCPIFPGQAARLSWPFPDPSSFRGTEAEIREKTRVVRDRIREQIIEFVHGHRAESDFNFKRSTMSKLRILCICIHNGARSQMTEEYLRKYGGDLFEVESAGLEPGTLNPVVVALLRDEGIDISAKKTRSVFDLHKEGRSFDVVIAVCDPEAQERCPIFPAERARLHWAYADPASVTGTFEEKLQAVRPIRDAIRTRVESFVKLYRETGRLE